jgi:hypothetical protein
VCEGEERTSEACAIFTAEYCANRPEDLVCRDLLRPVFRRQVNVPATLTLHKNGLKTTVDAKFVPDEICTCEEECIGQGADTTRVFYDEDSTLLTIETLAIQTGMYKVCLAPDGVSHLGEGYTEHVAFLEVTPAPGCHFQALEASPCADNACLEDPYSEACAQVTVAHCAMHPEDTGCTLMYPRFERQANVEGKLSIATTAKPGATILFTHDECPCDAPCNPYDVGILAETLGSEPGEGQLYLDVVGGVPALYTLCIDGVGVAQVLFKEPPCLFNGFDSPCEAPECRTAEDDYREADLLAVEVTRLQGLLHMRLEELETTSATAQAARSLADKANQTLYDYVEKEGSVATAKEQLVLVEKAMETAGIATTMMTRLLRASYLQKLLDTVPSGSKFRTAKGYVDAAYDAHQAAIKAEYPMAKAQAQVEAARNEIAALQAQIKRLRASELPVDSTPAEQPHKKRTERRRKEV